MSDGLDGVDDFGENPFEEGQPMPDSLLEEVPPEPMPNLESGVGSISTEEQEAPLGPGLLNYYSRYFQLTTTDFKRRILGSLSLRSGPPPPDLYGPLWITASVVMSRFLGIGLFSLFINGVVFGVSPDVTDSSRQFWKLVHSIWLFYAYTLLAPFVAHKLLSMSFISLISAYGYVNIIWVGGCLLLSGIDEFRTAGKKHLVITIVAWAVVFLIALKRSVTLYFQLESGRKSLLLLFVDLAFCVAARLLLF